MDRTGLTQIVEGDSNSPITQILPHNKTPLVPLSFQQHKMRIQNILRDEIAQCISFFWRHRDNSKIDRHKNQCCLPNKKAYC